MKFVNNYYNKESHEIFRFFQRKNSKSRVYGLILLLCTIPIGILWIKKSYILKRYVITLESNQQLLGTVSEKFLSFGLDSSWLRVMKTLPIDNEKFINLVRHLSPAYLRIGGTAADCLYFNQTMNDTVYNPVSKIIDRINISSFSISNNDFIALYTFSVLAHVNMVFDLNVLSRNVDGTWNSSNVKEIIQIAKGHGMKLDWQLGNEPNSFFHVFNITISAEQLATDYCQLRAILDKSGYEQSVLIGPEVNHIADNNKGEVYVHNFLLKVNNCIDYVSWHQYYLNGHIAQVDDFIDLRTFDQFPIEVNIMSQMVQSSGQNISMWLSETSSAYGGGAPDLSNVFVAGFLWLDKLGYSAKAGIQTIIRQSIFGNNYAMISSNLEPNPDWWIAVLFKKFVSHKVIDLPITNNFGDIRLYAHCALNENSTNAVSAITIYGMNLNKNQLNIHVKGLHTKSKLNTYILTSNNLHSRNIFLNGEILKLRVDGGLPRFKKKVVEINEPIELPSHSMIFLIIDNVDMPICLT